jgi:hypothetical protein
VPYDFLIVATGARHSYFGHDALLANKHRPAGGVDPGYRFH